MKSLFFFEGNGTTKTSRNAIKRRKSWKEKTKKNRFLFSPKNVFRLFWYFNFEGVLDINGSPGFDLLSEKEKTLCSNLKLYPQQYLIIKDTFLRESLRLGHLKKSSARQLVKIGKIQTGSNLFILSTNSLCFHRLCKNESNLWLFGERKYYQLQPKDGDVKPTRWTPSFSFTKCCNMNKVLSLKKRKSMFYKNQIEDPIQISVCSF